MTVLPCALHFDSNVHVHIFLQIQLRVDIDEAMGSAVLDFAGTGPEVRGNLNSPISVVHSAVIYCMRAMLNADIPLNAGCLVPVESGSTDSPLSAH